MPMALLASIAGPVIGGLLGNEGQQQTQTQQNKIDPRMDPYVYGANGVLPAAASWYGQHQGGMNNQMLTGMNNQWSQLGASGQGYNQMQNLGLSMMGGGVAGNPFGSTTGGMVQQPSYQPQQPQQSYQPAPMQMSLGPTTGGQFQMPSAPAYTPPQVQPQPSTPAYTPAPWTNEERGFR